MHWAGQSLQGLLLKSPPPPAQAHDSQAVRKGYGNLGRTGNQGPYT